MSDANEIQASILAAFENAKRHDEPYTWFELTDVLPHDTLRELRELPFDPPAIGDVSGTREAHNKSRSYLDVDARAEHPVARDFAQAMQDPRTIEAVEKTFGTDLTDTYLRLEYAQDTDGFWLVPHTDIGVKAFTMLLYMSEGHEALGTDVYADENTHTGRSSFAPGAAMVFVPSDDTWHGFEKRPIEGVRKSIVINYVTQDWRAREQLAYPDEVVRAA